LAPRGNIRGGSRNLSKGAPPSDAIQEGNLLSPRRLLKENNRELNGDNPFFKIGIAPPGLINILFPELRFSL
jgi:hypothetical protein